MGTGAGTISFGNTHNNKPPEETEESLIADLRKQGAKFNEKDMVFITRDQTGQIVWLENGNENAGLIHILDGKNGSTGHAEDFRRAYGVERSQIGSFLKQVVQNGKIVSSKSVDIGNGKTGTERVYEQGGNYYVLTGIGTNGFIVSAYPIRKEDL